MHLVSKSVCAKMLSLGDLRCITYRIQETVKSQSYTGAVGESGGKGWVRYLFRCEKSNRIQSVCWTYSLEQRTIRRKVTLQGLKLTVSKNSVEENGENTQRNESNFATRMCPTVLCGLLVSSSLMLIASLQNRAITFTYRWPSSGSVIYILISAEMKVLEEDCPPLRICTLSTIAVLLVLIHPRPCGSGKNASFSCSLLSPRVEALTQF